jgi:hypothetical protein
MLLSLMYLVIRMLLRLLVPDGQGEAAKDLEIVVLRLWGALTRFPLIGSHSLPRSTDETREASHRRKRSRH